MKARFTMMSSRGLLPLGFCAILSAVPLVLPAADPPRGAPIQFSGPKESVSTNLNNLAAKPNTFDPLARSLADAPAEIPKPFETTIAPVRPPSLRSPADTKRIRDLLEKRKNWTSMNVDDLMSNAEDEGTDSKLRARDKGKDD